MENFKFCTPTQFIFGRDAEMQVGNCVKTLDIYSVLVVYGQGSVIRSGLLDRVNNSLHALGIVTHHLGGVKPNPEDDLVYEGIKLCREKEIEGIIAVGGGSVIDTAKAIALGTLYDGDFWDFYIGAAVPERALPIGTVPTIPAAGSEGSGNSVITKIDGRLKLSVRTDVLRPKFSLMNPELTFTLPPFQTAAGIADMMAHIFERYFSDTPNVQVTDRIAEGLLMSIIEEAPKVMDDPKDYDARANIMWASTLAHNGLCGCGRKEDWVSHFMEHEISAMYDVTHGAGLSVVFPAWMTYMAEHKPFKVAQFARRVMGVKEADDKLAALEGISALKAFFSNVLKLPINFKELGIESPDIDDLVSRLHANKGEILNGYMKLTAFETRKIYEMMH